MRHSYRYRVAVARFIRNIPTVGCSSSSKAAAAEAAAAAAADAILAAPPRPPDTDVAEIASFERLRRPVTSPSEQSAFAMAVLTGTTEPRVETAALSKSSSGTGGGHAEALPDADDGCAGLTKRSINKLK
jgi:hypothetical protein